MMAPSIYILDKLVNMFVINTSGAWCTHKIQDPLGMNS